MAQKQTGKGGNLLSYAAGVTAALGLVLLAVMLAGPVDDPVTPKAEIAEVPAASSAPATLSQPLPELEAQANAAVDPVPEPETPAPAAPEEGVATAPEPEPETQSSDQSMTAGADVTPQPEAQPPAVPAMAPPSLDVVRVAPDGTAIVAGKAAPGAEVAVIVDDQEVSVVTAASGDGSFASFLTIPPTGQVQVLSLEARLNDQSVASLDQVILAPPAQVAQAAPAPVPAAPVTQAEPATSSDDTTTTQSAQAAPQRLAEEGATAPLAALAPEDSAPAPAPAPVEDTSVATAPAEADTPEIAAGSDPAAPSVSLQAPEASATPDAAAEAETQPADPVAPLAVLRTGPDGLEVLQPAENAEQVTELVLDAIGYSADGDVQLAGRASTGNTVRFYLNNRAVTSAPVRDDGRWAASFAGIAPGVYTLRLDELGADGDVVNRLETPFQREAPDVLQANTSGGDADAETAPVRAVTVQEGDTLWAISQARYGDGVLYVKVFEANRTDIRDPDLIYPGQVFTLPE